MSLLGYTDKSEEFSILESNEIKTAEIKIKNASDETITINAPTNVTDYILTMPSVEVAGALTTDGAGTLSWATSSSSTTPVALTTYNEVVNASATWIDGNGPFVHTHKIVQIGRIVFFSWGDVAGTNGSGVIRVNSIPSQFKPTNSQQFTVTISSLGTPAIGVARMSSANGLLDFYATVGLSSFAAGAYTIDGCTISWNLD